MKRRDNSIGEKKSCFGCGLCAIVCPEGAINFKRNKNGFFVPIAINRNKCIQCGLCDRVCNYEKEDQPAFTTPIHYLAAWSNDEKIRRICSSGGVALEIASHCIDLGYKVCAVRYNRSRQSAEHYIANTKEDLLQSIGSKYIQSDTFEAFSKIDLKEKYVIFGTPCQIDMWRRYIRNRKKESNFILIDFFCHGVPSYNVWLKYLREHKDIIDESSMITWRDKQDGWHSSWNISAYRDKNFGEAKPYYRSSSKNADGFYFMFLSNCALNPACYADCKYKQYKSSADIRLGDLWSTQFAKDEQGVSAVLAFSRRGKEILQELNITSIEIAPSILIEGQIADPLKRPWYYSLCRHAIKSKKLSIKQIRRFFVFSEIIEFQFRKLSHLWR